MSSADDAKLVARDPALPGLALLLDPSALALMLSREGSVVHAVRPTYVRYKPGMSCIVGYTVETAAGSYLMYGRAHRSNAPEKLAKAAQQSGGRFMREHAVVLFRFPNDHELRAVRRLGTGSPGARLQRLFPDHPNLWEGRLETLRYKPERRYVARLRVGGVVRAVVKFYHPDDFPRTSEPMKRLSSQSPLRIARRLRRSHRQCVTAVEWLDGGTLDDILADGDEGDVRRACHLAGGALAVVHGHSGKLKRIGAPLATRLSASADAIEALLPELGDRARRLAEVVQRRLSEDDTRPPCVIHGDFSADQVVMGECDAGIVDFDRVAYGDPCADLASFRAGLLRAMLVGRISAERVSAVFAELVEGYGAVSGRSPANTDPLAAASLLRTAVEPFRHREHEWSTRVEQIIEHAEMLASAPSGAHV